MRHNSQQPYTIYYPYDLKTKSQALFLDFPSVEIWATQTTAVVNEPLFPESPLYFETLSSAIHERKFKNNVWLKLNGWSRRSQTDREIFL